MSHDSPQPEISVLVSKILDLHNIHSKVADLSSALPHFNLAVERAKRNDPDSVPRGNGVHDQEFELQMTLNLIGSELHRWTRLLRSRPKDIEKLQGAHHERMERILHLKTNFEDALGQLHSFAGARLNAIEAESDHTTLWTLFEASIDPAEGVIALSKAKKTLDILQAACAEAFHPFYDELKLDVDHHIPDLTTRLSLLKVNKPSTWKDILEQQFEQASFQLLSLPSLTESSVALSERNHRPEDINELSTKLSAIGRKWINDRIYPSSSDTFQQLQELVSCKESVVYYATKSISKVKTSTYVQQEAQRLFTRINNVDTKDYGEFTATFWGLVSSGKSFSINNITGSMLLPTSAKASSTLPVRIISSIKDREPRMAIDHVALNERVQYIKQTALKKREEGPLASNGMAPKVLRPELPPSLQACLDDIKSNAFESFTKECLGAKNIQITLDRVNKVIRLSSHFDIRFPTHEDKYWPKIFVRFRNLPKLGGFKLELIDPPGHGDKSIYTKELKESGMLNVMTGISHAVIPVCNLSQVATEFAPVAHLLQTGRTPGLINRAICTNVEDADAGVQAEETMAKALWRSSSSDNTKRVLPCDNVKAMQVCWWRDYFRRRKQQGKPVFDTDDLRQIWFEQKDIPHAPIRAEWIIPTSQVESDPMFWDDLAYFTLKDRIATNDYSTFDLLLEDLEETLVPRTIASQLLDTINALYETIYNWSKAYTRNLRTLRLGGSNSNSNSTESSIKLLDDLTHNDLAKLKAVYDQKVKDLSTEHLLIPSKSWLAHAKKEWDEELVRPEPDTQAIIGRIKSIIIKASDDAQNLLIKELRNCCTDAAQQCGNLVISAIKKLPIIDQDFLPIIEDEIRGITDSLNNMLKSQVRRQLSDHSIDRDDHALNEWIDYLCERPWIILPEGAVTASTERMVGPNSDRANFRAIVQNNLQNLSILFGMPVLLNTDIFVTQQHALANFIGELESQCIQPFTRTFDIALRSSMKSVWEIAFKACEGIVEWAIDSERGLGEDSDNTHKTAARVLLLANSATIQGALSEIKDCLEPIVTKLNIPRPPRKTPSSELHIVF